jgi:hypothetical protein
VNTGPRGLRVSYHNNPPLSGNIAKIRHAIQRGPGAATPFSPADVISDV